MDGFARARHCTGRGRPDIDPRALRFTELMQWVLALPDFDDDPRHCGEKVLEAIQLAWMDEV